MNYTFVPFSITLTSLADTRKLITFVEEFCPDTRIMKVDDLGLKSYKTTLLELLGFMERLQDFRKEPMDIDIAKTLAFSDPKDALLFKLTWL